MSLCALQRGETIFCLDPAGTKVRLSGVARRRLRPHAPLAFVSAFVCSFRGLFACVLSWVEILYAPLATGLHAHLLRLPPPPTPDAPDAPDASHHLGLVGPPPRRRARCDRRLPLCHRMERGDSPLLGSERLEGEPTCDRGESEAAERLVRATREGARWHGLVRPRVRRVAHGGVRA